VTNCIDALRAETHLIERWISASRVSANLGIVMVRVETRIVAISIANIVETIRIIRCVRIVERRGRWNGVRVTAKNN